MVIKQHSQLKGFVDKYSTSLEAELRVCLLDGVVERCQFRVTMRESSYRNIIT